MSNVLLRTVVDDLVKDFKQNFDDKQIQTAQIAYWVLMVGDRLKAQHIAKRDSGQHLSTYIVPVEVHEDNSNPNEVKIRKHFILPKCIYDYDMDKGIEFIAYYAEEIEENGGRPAWTNQTFTRTTQATAKRLYWNKYEQPTQENPYFYRVGDHIYLLGIECVDIKHLEVGLYTTFDPVTEIDLDAPFDFPQELIVILKRQVLDMGRFVLLIPEERVNDGTDGTAGSGQVPTNKLVSVNELSEDNPNNK